MQPTHTTHLPCRVSFITGGLLLAFMATAVGCGRPTATIEGVVTLDGQALPDAMVQFFPSGTEGRTAAVKTDSNGRFSVTVSPHPLRVAISARQVVGQVKDGDGMADVLKELVPDRYRDASSSDLSVAPVAGGITKAEFAIVSTKR